MWPFVIWNIKKDGPWNGVDIDLSVPSKCGVWLYITVCVVYDQSHISRDRWIRTLEPQWGGRCELPNAYYLQAKVKANVICLSPCLCLPNHCRWILQFSNNGNIYYKVAEMLLASDGLEFQQSSAQWHCLCVCLIFSFLPSNIRISVVTMSVVKRGIACKALNRTALWIVLCIMTNAHLHISVSSNGMIFDAVLALHVGVL